MQIPIGFAPFCDAFIGGVSSAHGEILCQKNAFFPDFRFFLLLRGI